jgi:NTP pyrophosphatase (non-canonical NTP hydrolase)
MSAALRMAAEKFARYAAEHEAKSLDQSKTPAEREAAAAKGRTNTTMAALCLTSLLVDHEAPFADQATFMRACGQTVGAPNEQQALMYGRLIMEEFGELTSAGKANDEVEEFDAVLDLIVVLIGYAHSRGWPVGRGWREVVRSNMAKVDPTTGMVTRREDGKVLKPEGWTPPDLAGVLAGRL